MSLDMAGHVDGEFVSLQAVRIPQSGAYDANGNWQATAGQPASHSANVQPASDQEIQNARAVGERITDVRRLYLNDGITPSIAPSDLWQMDVGYGTKAWKTVALDNRPWRNYCKVIVVRLDDQ